MAVRAKMFVSKIERAAWNPEAVTVSLNVVSRGEENKEWASSTPSGEVKMTIGNPPAAKVFVDAFEAKQEFYVTFEPVER